MTTPAPDAHAPEDRFAALRSRTAVLTFVLLTLVVLAADLAVKYAAFRWVAGVPAVVDAVDPSRVIEAGDPLHLPLDHDPVVVMPGVLSLKLTTNTGAVFGIGKGGKWFFVLVSIGAVGMLGWFFARSHPRAWMLHAALALTLAGALGNLYDRVRYNAVRDMLWMLPETTLPFGLRWPGMQGGPGSDHVWPWIFNVADAALVVGVITLVTVTWWHELRRK
jgi:signal peptidase II